MHSICRAVTMNKSSLTFGRGIWMMNYRLSLSVGRTTFCDALLQRHGRILAHHVWESRAHIDYRGCEKFAEKFPSPPPLNVITRNIRLILFFFRRSLSPVHFPLVTSFRSLKEPLDVRTVRLDRNIANVPVRSSGFYSTRVGPFPDIECGLWVPSGNQSCTR